MAGVPPTMRALLLTGHGGPEMLAYREDHPVPEPAAGDVLAGVRRVRRERHRHPGA